MDIKLLKAAQLGDVGLLNKLLNEDPLILEKSALSLTAETPLHIAALAGKADFVHEIIIRKPSFAWKLNQDGFSPLHIAVAIGYGDVVQELLSFGNKDDVVTQHEDSSRLCLLRDKHGLIPLHYAAIKGEVSIIEELLRCCPESLKERATREQTVLHLAVNNCQFEAFKTLLEKFKGDDVKNFVDAEDMDGNTIYQMAVASKQLQVIKKIQIAHSEEIKERSVKYNSNHSPLHSDANFAISNQQKTSTSCLVENPRSDVPSSAANGNPSNSIVLNDDKAVVGLNKCLRGTFPRCCCCESSVIEPYKCFKN